MSCEGLTSTTVSRTSLLWWRVLCPIREDWKHNVSLSWIKSVSLRSNFIKAQRLNEVNKLTDTAARRWAVRPEDILLDDIQTRSEKPLWVGKIYYTAFCIVCGAITIQRQATHLCINARTKVETRNGSLMSCWVKFKTNAMSTKHKGWDRYSQCFPITRPRLETDIYATRSAIRRSLIFTMQARNIKRWNNSVSKTTHTWKFAYKTKDYC